MQTVAVQISVLRKAGLFIFQCFGGVQIFPVIFRAHIRNRAVISIDLCHCDMRIASYPCDRRDRVDNQVHTRIGRDNVFQLLLISFDK